MPRQLLWNAAAVGLCALMTTSAGFAETRHRPQVSAVSSSQSQYQSRDQYPAPATLIGTYHSNDFFPSPLVLNITGADRFGNLYGAISGWQGSWVGGETGDTWKTWQRVFGRDGTRAFYRDGKINIVFPNGATYILDNRGNQLTGEFTAGKEERPMTFLKSQGVAAR